MAANGGVLVHGEQPGRTGYTPEGGYGNGAGGSEVLAQGDRTWSATTNPWSDAPIHLYLMMDPSGTFAGYADDPTFACMRFGGPRPDATGPEFFSFPGPGTTGVPADENAGTEGPYNPAQLVGLDADATTGPNILLYTRGLGTHLQATRATLTRPSGPVDARMVVEDTRASVGDGSFFAGGGVLVPVSPLAPETSYTTRVDWQTPEGTVATQTFSFTTAPRDNGVAVRVTRLRRGRLRLSVSTPAPTATMRLSGARSRSVPLVHKRSVWRGDGRGGQREWESKAHAGNSTAIDRGSSP